MVCVSPLQACEVTDVSSLAVAPEAAWVALLMSLMHMQPAEWLRPPAVPLFEDTFSHFPIPSNSSYSFHSAMPHVSPTPCCLFWFKSSIFALFNISLVSPGEHILLKCAHRICCVFARGWRWLGEVCLNVGRVKDLVKSMIK